MHTNMPTGPQFNKQYQKHRNCLKLGGLQPKTIEAQKRSVIMIICEIPTKNVFQVSFVQDDDMVCTFSPD